MASITVSADTSKRQRKGFNWTPLILLAPALLFFGVLSAYPIVRMAINSFQKYGRAQLMGAPPAWVGGSNYVEAISRSSFLMVFLRTFTFMVVTVVLTIVLGTLLAMLMMQLNKFFRLFLSVALLLAWAIPPLTSGIVWGWILNSNYGVINYILTKVTGQNWLGHQWLINPVGFYGVLVVMVVWGAVPFIAFTSYAALSGIPTEVKEAASIDQAGPAKRFFLIELPYVRSVFIVLIVLSVIWDLTVFTQVVALQQVGGIADETSTLGTWIYTQGSASGNIGLSAAASVIMLVIMLAISVSYVRQTLNEGN